jgi:inhibitor of KinA sporulation pathway (predicted exonuclease)
MPNIFKAVDCTVTGIKCDNCDYRDDSVPFEDYQKYLNKECPKCKSNLLTQSDFDLCNKIVKYTRMYNIIYFPIHFIRYVLSKEYRNSITHAKIKFK